MTNRSTWLFVAVASAILMLTMGMRQSLALFLSPLNSATGIGIAGIGFVLAIGQFTWGAVQPVFGAVADRCGPGRVIVFGAVLLALGSVLTTLVTSPWGLVLALGVLSAAGAGAGAGAGSFSILIGATAQRIAPENRSFAGGVINAAGSLDQFVFAPACSPARWAAGCG